jgi:hypothetical protein
MAVPALTASRQDALIDAAEAAGSPISTGRRFAFLPLSSQAGTSTVAALAARALAQGRSGRTLLLATSDTGAGPLLAMGQQTPPVQQQTGLPRELSGALGYGYGVWTGSVGRLPGPAFTGSEAATGADWFQRVAPIARHFDVVCTDWHPQPNLAGVVAATRTAQAVCLVTPFARADAESAVALARAMHSEPDGPRVMVAFVDVARTRSTWPRLVAARLPFPVVRFGHDDSLVQGRRPRPITEISAIETAAQLMRLSTPGMDAE